jgi:hypothetical protein
LKKANLINNLNAQIASKQQQQQQQQSSPTNDIINNNLTSASSSQMTTSLSFFKNNNIGHNRTPSMTSNMTTNSIILPNPAIKSRFPRLQECAHFHYEMNTVDIPKNFKVSLIKDSDVAVENSKPIVNNGSGSANHSGPSNNPTNTNNNSSTLTTSNSTTTNSTTTPLPETTIWFQLLVTSSDKKWIIYRTYENFVYLDNHLHECIFDRKFSSLAEPASVANVNETIATTSNTNKKNKKTINSDFLKQLRSSIGDYFEKFGEKLASINSINCGPILNWFEIDNKGNRLFATDDSPINIPGVGAAVVKKRYVAQGLDEISLDVGNMISVIDMPPAAESIWWRGKKELEVGFFPSDCVELIRCNQTAKQSHLSKLHPNQSVRVKHGKLVTLLRSFFNTRPAMNHLKIKGILKQRLFGCDLGEHLINTDNEVPKILEICIDFIEKNGIVDGIYRHTGLQSNILRLRNAFDEEKFNEIENETYMHDVHAVSSLMKMYFRELPNPLLTFQLYQKFIVS